MDLSKYSGRILDLDAHLQLPIGRYPEIIGPLGQKLVDELGDTASFSGSQEGEVEATEENIWTVKGCDAPGASTLETRLKVMDMMGIERQLVFPQAVAGILIWSGDEHAVEAMRRYNDFAMEWTKGSHGRVRAMAILRTDTLEDALAETDRVIRLGAPAILIAEGRPIGGLSPADPALDPLWARLAEANVPLLMHIGGQVGFFRSNAWARAEVFRQGGQAAGEPVDAHLMMNIHMSPQNFTQTLIFGGVFERHPTLRLAAIELGASWVGPMAQSMDTIIRQPFSKRARAGLSMLPSEYLSRNFRATPYLMEDTATMIDRYGLEDVYAFSTDFPHEEGGKDPIGRLGGNMARHGEERMEKFFVSNAELILPAA